jgi:hypothetical protein
VEGSSSLAHLVFDMGDHTILARWHDNVTREMAFVTREELNRCEDATQAQMMDKCPHLFFLPCPLCVHGWSFLF